MDVIDSGKTNSQRLPAQSSRVYERPEFQELGRVDDLTWEGSMFDVTT